MRLARKAAGMSQTALADSIGVVQQTITKIERGDIVRSKYLPMIAAVLGVAPAWLDPEIGDVDRGLSDDSSAMYTAPGGAIPVFAARFGAASGEMVVLPRVVTRIQPPGVLARTPDAWGLYVVGETMAPEFWPGDVALIHPLFPPRQMDPVLLRRREGARTIVRLHSFVRHDESDWYVRQWNPEITPTPVSKADYPECCLVIGKMNRI